MRQPQGRRAPQGVFQSCKLQSILPPGVKKLPMIKILKWLAIVPFALLALLCYAVPGYSFSGLIFFLLAALILGYDLIGLLAENHVMAAKILRTALTTLLCFGILVVGLTEIPILQAAAGESSAQCGYVMVLGAGLRGGKPSQILQSRIDRAVSYLNENPDAICIVSGGQGADEAMSEAQCMYTHLTAAGIDPQRIWMEDRSTSTWENFRFTLDLVEEKTGARPDTLAVISSEFHLYRAGMFARDCGIRAIGIAAETPYLTLKINYYLREAAGVWHYILLGGQYHD